MAASADEVYNQATSLRTLMGQFHTGKEALEDPGALALSS
jgi:hypothetical protein